MKELAIVSVESATEPLVARVYRSEHTFGNKLARASWKLVWALFCRWSPRPFCGWRRTWLRLFGARMHRTAVVYPTARIWAPWNLEMGAHSALGDRVECYNVNCVALGEGAIVSQEAFLCTASHDISDPARKLITAPIRLERLSWVCARAFVNLGTAIGEGAVVGAGAVVVKNVRRWTVVAGNPAKPVKKRVLRAGTR